MSRIAAVCCLLLFASAALAHNITVEDYFTIASVTDCGNAETPWATTP